MGEAHDDLHVVLHDHDRQVLRDAADQLHGLMRLRHAHACRRFVEAEQLRVGGERDADLEVALLAVGQVGGQLPVLVAEPHGLQHGVGARSSTSVNAR